MALAGTTLISVKHSPTHGFDRRFVQGTSAWPSGRGADRTRFPRVPAELEGIEKGRRRHQESGRNVEVRAIDI